MKGIKAGWNAADMKHLAFGICVAFVMLGAFAGVSVASATTIYVPDNYAKIRCRNKCGGNFSR